MTPDTGCPPGRWSSLPGLRAGKRALRRVWLLSGAFLLVLIVSLLFPDSHHSVATLPYLGAPTGAAGARTRWPTARRPGGAQWLDLCRCVGEAGATNGLGSCLESDLSPVRGQRTRACPLMSRAGGWRCSPRSSHTTGRGAEATADSVGRAATSGDRQQCGRRRGWRWGATARGDEHSFLTG